MFCGLIKLGPQINKKIEIEIAINEVYILVDIMNLNYEDTEI